MDHFPWCLRKFICSLSSLPGSQIRDTSGNETLKQVEDKGNTQGRDTEPTAGPGAPPTEGGQLRDEIENRDPKVYSSNLADGHRQTLTSLKQAHAAEGHECVACSGHIPPRAMCDPKAGEAEGRQKTCWVRRGAEKSELLPCCSRGTSHAQRSRLEPSDGYQTLGSVYVTKAYIRHCVCQNLFLLPLLIPSLSPPGSDKLMAAMLVTASSPRLPLRAK